MRAKQRIQTTYNRRESSNNSNYVQNGKRHNSESEFQITYTHTQTHTPFFYIAIIYATHLNAFKIGCLVELIRCGHAASPPPPPPADY